MILLVAGVTLTVVLWVGAQFLQGYLYTEPAVGTFACITLPDEELAPIQHVTPTRSGTLDRALNLPLPYSVRGLPGLHRPPTTGIDVDSCSAFCGSVLP